MTPLFAILIPTLPDRKHLLDRVMAQLNQQRAGHNCIIIINEDNYERTTGVKRNELIEAALERKATHVAFVDDDDLVGPNYVKRNMEGVNGDFDCCELWGQYYENGRQFNPFHHSLIHKRWYQDDKFYYRMPNHLNCVKLDLIKDIRYEDITVGEDGRWSEAVRDAGVLKTEYPVKEIIYYYFQGKSKTKHQIDQEPIVAQRRGISLNQH